MAHYVTRIDSGLSPAEAFSYLADFSHARDWDPSVVDAQAVGGGEVGGGTIFDLRARFGGKEVPLRYTIVEHDPPRRVVLEARRPGFVSRDTITVEPREGGSTVHYDAVLSFNGIGRLLDPLMQRIFARVGARASEGLRVALNP